MEDVKKLKLYTNSDASWKIKADYNSAFLNNPPKEALGDTTNPNYHISLQNADVNSSCINDISEISHDIPLLGANLPGQLEKISHVSERQSEFEPSSDDSGHSTPDLIPNGEGPRHVQSNMKGVI